MQEQQENTPPVAPVDAVEASRLWRWQIKLLPFVVGAITLLAIFFFVSSISQLEKLNRDVAHRAGTQIDQVLADVQRHAAALPNDQKVALLQWRANAALESEIVQQRYRQVNSTLLLRAWTRHMGFMTGMIMAFIGAIFILSKLKEQETSLTGQYQGVSAGLATSSPGIVLSALGTMLMLVAIIVDYTFETRDVPVYLPPAVARELPPPADLGQPGSDASENQLFPPQQRDPNGANDDAAAAR